MSPAARPLTRPVESTLVHTRILRCMLATDDCLSYWRNVDVNVPASARAQVAFEQRWFGTKSEARVRTIMTDMVERFDAYPEALALFQRLPKIAGGVRTFLCHLHTQLADPIYRAFTGVYLPHRRAEGRATIDIPAVVRWVESEHPGRWAGATNTKFASNLLATAFDVGLIGGRRDPRGLPMPAVPGVVMAYALQLLRRIDIEGSLTENPYLRSLGYDTLALARLGRAMPGVRVVELGGMAEVIFDEPNLMSWGLRHLAEGA